MVIFALILNLADIRSPEELPDAHTTKITGCKCEDGSYDCPCCDEKESFCPCKCKNKCFDCGEMLHKCDCDNLYTTTPGLGVFADPLQNSPETSPPDQNETEDSPKMCPCPTTQAP